MLTDGSHVVLNMVCFLYPIAFQPFINPILALKSCWCGANRRRHRRRHCGRDVDDLLIGGSVATPVRSLRVGSCNVSTAMAIDGAWYSDCAVVLCDGCRGLKVASEPRVEVCNSNCAVAHGWWRGRLGHWASSCKGCKANNY